MRDTTCLELLDTVRIDLIKGNASEIARIAGESVQTKGVDATEVSMDLVKVAKGLAGQRLATVVITGKEDLVTDGQRLFRIGNGHPIMASVVGTGCMATSVIGTFAAVEPDLCVAAASGLVCFEVAAELAAEECAGPASFKQNLFDCLYQLHSEAVHVRQRIEIS